MTSAPSQNRDRQGAATTPEEAALRRKNLKTAMALLAIILFMASLSYFGRFLMVPVLFKT